MGLPIRQAYKGAQAIKCNWEDINFAYPQLDLDQFINMLGQVLIRHHYEPPKIDLPLMAQRVQEEFEKAQKFIAQPMIVQQQPFYAGFYKKNKRGYKK